MEHGVKLAIEILKKLSVVLHVLHTTQSLSFHVVVLQRTHRNLQRFIMHACSHCSASKPFFFIDVHVAVAIMVFLSSRFTKPRYEAVG